jgi:hypothetical protein
MGGVALKVGEVTRGAGVGIFVPAGRRSRRKGQSDLDLVAFGGLAFLAYRGAWVALAAGFVLLVNVWLAFVRKTPCDVENKSGRGACGNDARGALRACYRSEHKRAKRDALFALFGLDNPGRRWRIMWSRDRSPGGRRSPLPTSVPPKVTRPLHDALVLVATVVGSIAAVVSTVIDLT